MTEDPKPPPPPDPGGLQFDRAETPNAEAADGCAACKAPIRESYYLAGVQRICAACSAAVQQGLASGSPTGRFIKALALGLVAALVSGAVWAFIIIQFDMIIGLLAIGVGLLVGLAVRKGSEGRGGRSYQVLALALTYFGIAIGYSGAMIPAALKAQSGQASEKTAAAAPPTATPDPSPAPAAPQDAPPPSAGGCLMGVILLLGLSMASPFLIAKESIISVLILGFALWEAWKFNRGISVDLKGPFRIVSAPPPPPEAATGG
jgi:hypothetical protein